MNFLVLSLGIGILLAQQEIKIKHVPIAKFIHGEKLEIKASVSEDVEWLKLFFRHKGAEQFQVVYMGKSDRTYIYLLDTSQFPVPEFEYYFLARTKERLVFLPLNAPEESLLVTGESKVPLPEKPAPKEERVRLPFSLNGSVQNKLKEKEENISEKKTLASGNLQVIYNYQKKDGFSINIDSNLSYSNNPLPEEKSLDLTNLVVDLSMEAHTLKVGDISINESHFTVSGLGRRGLEYIFDNKKAYFHLFDVSSQQAKGFKGFAPKSDLSLFGGVLGYRFFNEAFSLKAVYLTGKDDPSKGVNIGFSPLFQSRKGIVMALVEEARLFKDSLRLNSEFARSNYDGDLTDMKEAVLDNAWTVSGVFSYGGFNFGANYRYIGKDFNSIGYQFFTNDRKGYETTAGFRYKGFNLSGSYIIQQDNVKDDPAKDTTNNNNALVNLSLSLSGQISLNLGFKRDKQDTYRDNVKTSLYDSLTNSYQAGLSINLSKSSIINISILNSELTSENNPQNDTSSLTLNIGGSFRSGETLFLYPNFSFSKVTNIFTNKETQTYNAFLTSELAFIPKVFSILLLGSFNRSELAPDNISTILSLDGGANLYLDRLIKIGSVVFSLKGNYSYNKTGDLSRLNYRVFLQFNFSF